MFSTVLIIVIFGAIIRRIFTQDHINELETFILKISLPAALFNFTLKNNLVNIFNQTYSISYLAVFIVSGLITLVFFNKKTSSEILTRVLCSTYVNAAIYTIPVMMCILGDAKAAVLGHLLQVVCIQPLFIIIFCLIQNKRRAIFKNIITSPIVFMPCLGLFLNYFKISFYDGIINSIEMLAQSSTPLSLLVFGMTLGGFKISKIDKDVVFASIIKNIIHPVVGFIIGKYFFLLEGYWLKALVLSTAAPTAFIAYLLTKNFTEDGEFAKNVVSLTSIASIPTLLIIYLIEL